jgi:hypothetical protein
MSSLTYSSLGVQTVAFLQTVNCYGILAYTSSLKPFFHGCGGNFTCQEEATSLLFAMLLVDLLLSVLELRNAFFELVSSAFYRMVSRRRPTYHLLARDQVNKEYVLDEYEGVLFDYAQVVISFGYVTWFGALHPLVTLMAWSIVVIQIRTDAFKLSYSTQRPFPLEQKSIGSWIIYLQFLSLGSLIHNAAIATLWYSAASAKPNAVHDILLMKVKSDEELFQIEVKGLVVFCVFAILWFLFGVLDRQDRDRLKALNAHHKRQRFLENKYLNSIEKISENVIAALPSGGVFLNGKPPSYLIYVSYHIQT